MKKLYAFFAFMLICSFSFAQTIRQVSLPSCSGGTWDIQGLDENTPVIWSVSGSMAIKGVNNKHFVELQGPNGTGVAYGTLYVTFTSPGNSLPTTLSKPVNLGSLYINGPTSIQTNTYGGSFSVEHFPEATNYEWQIYPNSSSFYINGQGSNFITLSNNAPPGGYSLTLKITTRCGEFYAGEHAFGVTGSSGGPGGGGGCTSGCEEEPWFVYPNPAVEQLNVEVSSENSSASVEALLYDASGQVRKRGNTKNGKLRLDTSDLPKGVYYLITTDGKKNVKKQILIDK
jgi:hypothetical protein